MSEEQKALDPEIVEAQKTEVKKIPRLQYVFITLADGRRGVFAGPELITKAELLLKPPVLVDLVFSEPKETTDVDNTGTVEQKA
jgi:hypothetical protein